VFAVWNQCLFLIFPICLAFYLLFIVCNINFMSCKRKNSAQRSCSSVPHTLTVLMRLCLCRIYRQLNSILSPIYHIPKIVKETNSKRASHTQLLVLAGNLKVGKPMLCCCFVFQTQHISLHKKRLLFYINSIISKRNVSQKRVLGRRAI